MRPSVSLVIPPYLPSLTKNCLRNPVKMADDMAFSTWPWGKKPFQQASLRMVCAAVSICGAPPLLTSVSIPMVGQRRKSASSLPVVDNRGRRFKTDAFESGPIAQIFRLEVVALLEETIGHLVVLASLGVLTFGVEIFDFVGDGGKRGNRDQQQQ